MNRVGIFRTPIAVSFAAAIFCALPAAAETLEHALDLAVQADLKMAASQRPVDAAASTAQAAKALALPKIAVEALYTRLSKTSAIEVDLGSLQTELALADRSFGSYRIGATLPVYTGGRTRNTMAAAEFS